MSTAAELYSRAPAPGIPPNVQQFTSAFLLGGFLNWGLLGALTVQAYIYYLSFPNDRKLPKYTAWTVYVIEIAQTFIVTRQAYQALGSGFGDMAALNDVGVGWIAGPVMGGITGAMGQIFYAWRIWLFSGSYWIPVGVVALAILQCVYAIVVGVLAFKAKVFTKLRSINRRNTPVWLITSAVCDLVIAGAMTYYLLTARTGIKSTQQKLVRVVRLSLETGTITAGVAILEVILFLVYENNYYLIPAFAISKLYSNSLFTVLNARATFGSNSDRNEVSVSGDVSMSKISKGRIPVNFAHARDPAASMPHGRGVHVDVHVEHTESKLDMEEGKYSRHL